MEDLLTGISIILATVTWLATYFKDRAAQRVAHTANVLAALSTSDRLAESSFQMTKLINSGADVSFVDLDAKNESHVVDILDYYEFVCDLYANGILSRDTIMEVRGRLMRRTWIACAPYIMKTREIQKRPVYSGFEKFVKELPYQD